MRGTCKEALVRLASLTVPWLLIINQWHTGDFLRRGGKDASSQSVFDLLNRKPSILHPLWPQLALLCLLWQNFYSSETAG